MAKKCKAFDKADIYSAGIILFGLKYGFLPYIEDTIIEGIDFQNSLYFEPKSFWKAHSRVNNVREPSEEFKELFLSMIKKDASKRATIESIKQSRWYQGPTYNQNELVGVLSSLTTN